MRQKLYVETKKEERQLPLIREFLGRKVKVKIENLEIRGTLVRIVNADKENRLPNMLILKDDLGRWLIIRGNFESVSVVAKK